MQCWLPNQLPTISGDWLTCQHWPNVGKPPPTLATIGDGPMLDCYLGTCLEQLAPQSSMIYRECIDKLLISQLIMQSINQPIIQSACQPVNKSVNHYVFPLWGRHFDFVLSVCPSVHLSVWLSVTNLVYSIEPKLLGQF